jgi:nitrite reductase/ring-hydroxylating ferredoxin subunit
MAHADDTSGPDLTQGVSIRDLSDRGTLVGHVGDDHVLVARVGDELFAIGAHCTHYHGPLGDGLIVGDTVRCPWHHACFSLRSGEALRAPALDAVDCGRRRGGPCSGRHGAAPRIRRRDYDRQR